MTSVDNNDDNSKSIFRAPGGGNAFRHSDRDRTSYQLAEYAFSQSSIPLIDKLECFSRFTTKRSLSRFLVKAQIFEKILQINGVIIECGVFHASGLFTWAQLSNIFEPVNYNRRIIGFDTFEGFPSVDSADNSKEERTPLNQVGDLKGSSLHEISLSLAKYRSERHLSHIDNIELVSGDFNQTADEFLSRNPQLIVSLLYLDFDLYKPTKKALSTFLPKMPKGSIVAFDELNCNNFPGETVAFDEIMNIKMHKIQRSTIDPWISYIVLE